MAEKIVLDDELKKRLFKEADTLRREVSELIAGKLALKVDCGREGIAVGVLAMDMMIKEWTHKRNIIIDSMDEELEKGTKHERN